MNKLTFIPVYYVGLQEGYAPAGIPDFHLVDEPNGSTVAFKPEKHIIVGITRTAWQRGIKEVPGELHAYLKDREARAAVAAKQEFI